MGGKHTVPAKSNDGSSLEQDTQLRQGRHDGTYVKWKCVPDDRKQKVKSMVIRTIVSYYGDIDPSLHGIYIPYHRVHAPSIGPNVWISASDAIIEVITEMKPELPFTVHSDGYGWFVSFVHYGKTLKS